MVLKRLVIALMFSGSAFAQSGNQTVGPINSQAINYTQYVGTGNLSTVQSALLIACGQNAGYGRVEIQQGSSPSDGPTLSGETSYTINGCANVTIIDQRGTTGSSCYIYSNSTTYVQGDCSANSSSGPCPTCAVVGTVTEDPADIPAFDPTNNNISRSDLQVTCCSGEDSISTKDGGALLLNPGNGVSMDTQKLVQIANGTVSTDAAAFGQIPTALPASSVSGTVLEATHAATPFNMTTTLCADTGANGTSLLIGSTATSGLTACTRSWSVGSGGQLYGVPVTGASSGLIELQLNSTDGSAVFAGQSGHTALISSTGAAQFYGLNADSQKITNVANGTVSTDVAAFGQVITPSGSPASSYLTYFTAPGAVTGTANATLNSSGNLTITGIGDQLTGLFTSQTLTSATSGANVSAGSFYYKGNYYTGSASATDTWQVGPIFGTGANPSVTYYIAHSGGTSGPVSVSMPTTVVSGNMSSTNVYLSQAVTVSGVGTGLTAVCTTGYVCNNRQGAYTLTSTTFTTGNLLTLTWTATASPMQCNVYPDYSQSTGYINYYINAPPSTTTVTFNNQVSLAGLIAIFHYTCNPQSM